MSVLVVTVALVALAVLVAGGLLYIARNPYEDRGRWDGRRDGEV